MSLKKKIMTCKRIHISDPNYVADTNALSGAYDN